MTAPIHLPETPWALSRCQLPRLVLILQHTQMKGRDQRSLPNHVDWTLDFFLVLSLPSVTLWWNMSWGDSSLNTNVLHTIHWCHVASMLVVVTPNQEELSLYLKRNGAFSLTDQQLFYFEVTNLQSGFFGTLPGNDSTLKKFMGSWQSWASWWRIWDYQSGKWKHALLEDNQSNFSAQSCTLQKVLGLKKKIK